MRASKLKRLAIAKVYDSYENNFSLEINQWLKSCIDDAKQIIIKNNKNIQRYEDLFSSLPTIPGEVNIINGTVKFDALPKKKSTFKQQILINNLIDELIPWRKGPYNLIGVPIESEWNCSIK